MLPMVEKPGAATFFVRRNYSTNRTALVSGPVNLSTLPMPPPVHKERQRCSYRYKSCNIRDRDQPMPSSELELFLLLLFLLALGCCNQTRETVSTSIQRHMPRTDTRESMTGVTDLASFASPPPSRRNR